MSGAPSKVEAGFKLWPARWRRWPCCGGWALRARWSGRAATDEVEVERVLPTRWQQEEGHVLALDGYGHSSRVNERRVMAKRLGIRHI
jgi:hypothetical protein